MQALVAKRTVKLIASLAGAFVGFIILLGGALVSILPSGSPDVVQKYKTISQQTASFINWQDPYILDYFRRDNDFSNITDAEIQATVNLFFHYETVVEEDPKTHKKTTVHRRVPNSLLDVMTRLGYSQDDYEVAINMEREFLGEDVSSYDVSVPELRYKNIDPTLLYNYVHARSSIFTLDDMRTIEAAAQEYDVNPALLVAITGQEESFVPTYWPAAPTIKNNPFNVYVSWQDYNTTLADSARIAAETIHNKLVTPPPNGEDPIQWINDPNNPAGIYATDRNWAYGVEDIFGNIMAYVGMPLSAGNSTTTTTKGH